MFRFADPNFLYLLILLPFLVALYLYSNYHRRQNIRKYGDPALLKGLMPTISKYRPDIKFWLTFAALTLVILMLARPQFGSKMETVKRSGVEAVIALDISNSMLAEDVTPSRLDKSKKLISRLVDTFNNDKVGLIVFAGDAFTQLPITSDYVSAKMFLETINPSLITTQGTDIGAAIRLAMKSFTPQEGVGRAIIVITDGENHEGGAVEAAQEAAEKGMQVFVLGVGSPDGSPIPAEDGSNNFRRDKDGNVIVTRLNEQMCQEIAKAGNGMYIRVDNTNSAEKVLNNEIAKLSKADVESQVYTEFDEQFQALAWLVLILLVVEMLILERKIRFSKMSDYLNKECLCYKNLYHSVILTCGKQCLRPKTERDYLRSGNKLYNDSLFIKAEVDYRKALEINPKSTDAMFNLGNSLLMQQKAKEAMEQFESASKVEKDKDKLAQIYHNMGVILQSSKQYPQCIEAYKESLRNNPKDDETRYNLALAQKLLKDQQQNQDQNQDKNQDQKQDQKDDKKDQNKNQQEQDKKDQQNQNQQQQQQNKDEMSKENAQQLLNAVMQDEKNVQDKVKKQLQIQGKKLDKDW